MRSRPCGLRSATASAAGHEHVYISRSTGTANTHSASNRNATCIAHAGKKAIYASLWCALIFAATGHTQTPPQQFRFTIVVTGSELLDGVYADQHTYFLTRTLRPLGWRCAGSISVDDRPEDIKRALRFATEKAPLVIVTGGLGPTDTDVTRTALADFSGVELREHADVLRELERRFKTPRTDLRDNLRRQAQVPTGGSYLANQLGTAVGLVYEFPQGTIVALPGPPRELRPMVANELIPYLNRRFGTRLPGAALTLRFVGIGQSRINQTLKDQAFVPDEVVVTTQFSHGRVDYTFSFPEDKPAQRKQLEAIQRELRKRLGDYIYGSGVKSLESHILAQLASRKQTLAIAEVGTAGELTRGLSRGADNPETLAGAYIAPTDYRLGQILDIAPAQWQRALTGTEKARQLALAVSAACNSTWAVSVGEVQRNDAAPSELAIAIRTPDGQLDTHTLRFTGSLTSSQARLSTSILNLLRQRLRQ